MYPKSVNITKLFGRSIVNIDDTVIVCEIVEGGILVPAMNPNESYVFNLEFNTSVLSTDHKVQFSLFDGSNGQILSMISRFSLSQPLSISHTIINNAKLSLVRFKIENHNKVPVRIVTTQAISQDNLCEPVICDQLLIYHGQACYFMASYHPSNEKNLVSINIKYRHLSHELKEYLFFKIRTILKDQGLSNYYIWLKCQIERLCLPLLNNVSFIAAQVSIPNLNLSELKASTETLDLLKNCILEINTMFDHVHLLDVELNSKDYKCESMIYETQLPKHSVFVVASWSLGECEEYVVGQIILCRIVIKSTSWDTDIEQISLNYEVDLRDSFSFAGLRKHCFVLKVNNLF